MSASACIISRQDDLRELGFTASDGVTPDESQIRNVSLQLSLSRHPDEGGTKEDFQKLSNAYQPLPTHSRYPPTHANNYNATRHTNPYASHYSTQRDTGPSREESAAPSDISDNKSHDGSTAEGPSWEEPDLREDYFNFFHRAWQSESHWGKQKSSYHNLDDFDDYFTNWETATTKTKR